MIRRRKLLASLGALGGTVALAGCSGSGSPDEETEPESGSGSDSESGSAANSTEDTEEDAETTGLTDVAVGDIRLTYGFSSGIRARIQLTNEAEEGTKSVYAKIEAFGGEQSLGTDSTWNDIAAGFSAEADLTIDSVNSLEDNSIDDVTEFVISGRLEGEDSTEIESLTGQELRSRVDTDN